MQLPKSIEQLQARGPPALSFGTLTLEKGLVDPDGAVAATLLVVHGHPFGLGRGVPSQCSEQTGTGDGVVDRGDALRFTQLQHALMAGNGQSEELFRPLWLLDKLGELAEKVVGLAQER